LEAATRRSAAATSGRRSSSCEGTPLELGAHDAEIDELRARRLHLGLRQSDVRIRRDAGGESLGGDVERRLEGNDGLLQQLSLRVEPAQVEIIHREFGVHTEFDRSQIGCARLLPGLRTLDGMAHFPE
jgi:hypothetical protein